MTVKSFEEQFEKLHALFESGRLNLWVISYGITHEVMVIAVFKENFMDREEIILGDCKYFSGKLKGQPYKLHISSNLEQEGKERFTIQDEEGQLKIVFCQMTLPIP